MSREKGIVLRKSSWTRPGPMFGVHPGFARTKKEARNSLEKFEALRNALGDDAWIHALGVGSVEQLSDIQPYIDSFDNSSLITTGAKGWAFDRDKGTWTLDVSTREKRATPETNRNRLQLFSEYGYNEKTVALMDKLAMSENEAERVLGSDMILRLLNFYSCTGYLKEQLWGI